MTICRSLNSNSEMGIADGVLREMWLDFDMDRRNANRSMGNRRRDIR